MVRTLPLATVLVWAALTVLAGGGTALALALLDLQGRVAHLEDRLDRLALRPSP